jgi:hypothetical protein
MVTFYWWRAREFASFHVSRIQPDFQSVVVSTWITARYGVYDMISGHNFAIERSIRGGASTDRAQNLVLRPLLTGQFAVEHRPRAQA